MNDTPHEAAMADVLQLIDKLELPYLESLQKLLAEHIVKRRIDLIAEARAKIMKIALNVGLTPEELVQGVRQPHAPVDRKPPKPRYRDPASGKTWSGFGAAPGWIRDRDRSQFLIGDRT
jgi:DNA-binding protein H-NS